MGNSRKKRLLFAVFGIFLCVCMTAGALALLIKKPAKAAVTDGQTMFATDGSSNIGLIGQMRTLASNAGKTTVNSIQRSTATQIRVANGGALPSVNLFQSGGSGDIASFRSQSWQLVYISYKTDGTPVFTFMMAGAYRDSIFGSSASDYSTTTVRTNLTADFNTVLGSFPGASSNIVTPGNLPGTWQSNQANGNGSLLNSITGAALNDLIWLPSELEIGTHSSAVWGLTQNERSYTENGFSASAWLRGRASQGSGNHGMVVTSAGATTNNNALDGNGAVRPAIHLSFPSTPLPPITPTSDPLFNVSGNHNTGIATKLQMLADNTAKTTVSGTQRSDAAQIRTANGGVLPEVNLFESGGVSDVATFRNQSWRLVYITYPSDGGSPVFTFMMTGAYRSSAFHASSPDYETSTVRTNLTTDFAAVLSNFSNVSGNIVRPSNLPDTWQSNQADSGSYIDNSLTGTALNDYIWLPSYREIAGGLWKPDNAERGYTQNGFGAYAWMRNKYSVTGGTVSTISSTGSGFSSSQALTAINAVRPAIHITLPQTGDIVSWNPQTAHSVTNNTSYSHTFAEATEIFGATNFTYTIMSGALPTGLTFNGATRMLSGTPMAAAGVYSVTIRASVNGMGIERTINITVNRGEQAAPSAPAITLNAAGQLFVTAISGGQYQWRLQGDTTWNLAATNTINVPTGINNARTYEVQQRFAQTTYYNASPWSATTTLAHNTYTVSYNANGGTGTVADQTKYHGTSNQVTLSNGSTLSRVGWTLSRWDTNAAGTGQSYVLGANYSLNAGLALYAVWTRIPITWSLTDRSYNVTNGATITNVALPMASGGNGAIVYTVTGLPNGLNFDPAGLIIYGTPNAAAGVYPATATARSAYDSGYVEVTRTITFSVSLPTQATPSAPTLTINESGDTVTIAAISGGEYQWRYTGAATWTDLDTNNTFAVSTGISAGRTYEAQRRLAETGSYLASAWSSAGTLEHPTYTITYDSNGGSGTILNGTKYHGTLNPATLSNGTGFSRLGWDLVGWSTQINGSPPIYGLSGLYTENAGLTLYAVWTRTPVFWSLANTSTNVTNGIAMAEIVLPAATGGNGIYEYNITGLPSGLTFDPGTLKISGIPNAVADTYDATVTASSGPEGDTVSVSRTLTFFVALGAQAAPTAPAFGLNVAGDIVTIEAVSGCEYQWRLSGESTWIWLSTSNTFAVQTGITAGRIYEVQRRFAATNKYAVSPWSETASEEHPTYTVGYDSNGGSGTAPNQIKYHGTLNPVFLHNSGYVRPGWSLTGWNTEADGSGTPYALNAAYTGNAGLILFAVWSPNAITWSPSTPLIATNDVFFTHTFDAATDSGGATDFVYTHISGTLPSGLSFNALTRVLSGTPNIAPGNYFITIRASLGSIDTDRLITVTVLAGSQSQPTAPELSINLSGDTITITHTAGHEYQWRLTGDVNWTDLRATNTFTIEFGISTSRTYEVQRRLAATVTHNESAWSVSTTMPHPTHTITYNSNGGNGNIASQTKYHGTLNPISLDGGGNFTRIGWNLTGWNTMANGAGEPYALNATYTDNAGLILFAVWTQNTLEWNPQLSHIAVNGVAYSHTFAAATEQFGATNFTYSFVSGTLPNGLVFNTSTRTLSGTSNAVPSDHVFVIRASMYGVNLDRIITVTVTAGNQTTPEAPELNMNQAGDTITIAAISGGEYRWRYIWQSDWTDLRENNIFNVPTGLATNTTYEAQRRLAMTSTHIASDWSPSQFLNHATYTITYNSNGGSGSIPNQSKYHGILNPVTLDGGGVFTRQGWELTGWNTMSGGTGSSYALNGTYAGNAGLTLYAVWERIPVSWSLGNPLYNVTNGIVITNIFLPEADGGNGILEYSVTGLPNGLAFDTSGLTISGTPNDTAGTYHATATATSTYNGGSVSATRTISFAVSLASQGTPSTPSLSISVAGDIITIQAVAGGEYQWRFFGDSTWIELGTSNIITVVPALAAGKTYEAQCRFSKTEIHEASDWSVPGTLVYPYFTVIYDSNSGSGSIAAQVKYYGSLYPLDLSGGGTFARPGWSLTGWNTASNGLGATYALGASYTANADAIMYAVWERIPISWSLTDSSHNVINGVAISGITLPFASGGNNTIIYTVAGLPNGLTFNTSERIVSGTPNIVPGTYIATATATSAYDGGSVSASRTISFTVVLGSQITPTAPTFNINQAGDTITITHVTGHEYQWRLVGSSAWNDIGTDNIFVVPVGITAARSYEVQRRLALTETHAASAWSASGTLAHPTYTITYSANGGSGTIINQTKFHGTLNPVTLNNGAGLSNVARTLARWDTNATGTGTPYALGTEYTANAGLTLFAIWSENAITWSPLTPHLTNYDASYTHTFAAATEPGGATGFTYSLVAGTLPSGLSFNTSTLVLSGTPRASLGDYSVTIRASIGGINADRVITITIRAGIQIAPSAPNLSINEFGNVITIQALAGAEYRWRLAGTEDWTDLIADNTFIVAVGLTAGKTYEAQRQLAATSTHEASPWSPAGTLAHPSYMITYSNNSGTGSILPQTKYHGTSNPVVLNSGIAFSRQGWVLIGWNTESNGSGISFALDSTYSANAGMTLFAVWERVQIIWDLVNAEYNVTNGTAITNIFLPFATGGNGNIVYTIINMPNGLMFDAASLIISGTPNIAYGTYIATVTAASTYDGGTVTQSRTITFYVSRASQLQPSAPTLSINSTGDTITITHVDGHEYQWRIQGSGTWASLGATNTFNISAGVTVGVTYEVQRRLVSNDTHAASPWSSSGLFTHETYTIIYNSNGYTGTIASQTKYYGTLNPIILRNGSGFIRSGWHVSSWNTNAAGTGEQYDFGAQYTANSNIELFAVWAINGMTWNPALALPDGIGGQSYTRTLAPLATGLDQTFTYTLLGDQSILGGLTLSPSGVLFGTLNQVAGATTMLFVVIAQSTNGQTVTSGTFTLTVNPGCANPCVDPNCPIHGANPPPDLPGAKLEKDEDKLVLVGISDTGIFIYKWSSKVGRGTYSSIDAGQDQMFIVFTQHEKSKVTYRCQIYFGDKLVKTVTYVIYPPRGSDLLAILGGEKATLYGMFGIGICIFIILLIILWFQRDRKPKKNYIVGHGDEKPRKRRNGLIRDEKPRKRKTGLIR